MAVNVTLGEVKTQEKPFPKLMKHPEGCIVFFSKNKIGICLNGDMENPIGDYSEGWDMKGFADYNEPITLQNA